MDDLRNFFGPDAQAIDQLDLPNLLNYQSHPIFVKLQFGNESVKNRLTGRKIDYMTGKTYLVDDIDAFLNRGGLVEEEDVKQQEEQVWTFLDVSWSEADLVGVE